MSETVPEVEGKGKGSDRLDENLESNGKSTKASSKGSSVNGHTKRRKQNVAESSKVEDTTESNTSNSVETRKNHGDFGLVDGQMRGDRTVGSLLLEDLQSLIVSSRDSSQGSIKISTIHSTMIQYIPVSAKDRGSGSKGGRAQSAGGY